VAERREKGVETSSIRRGRRGRESPENPIPHAEGRICGSPTEGSGRTERQGAELNSTPGFRRPSPSHGSPQEPSEAPEKTTAPVGRHMNLAVKFNLLKNTQPHYSYTPESCLENDSYKLYFDRTILTDIHIKHNRPDIIILNKQQKQAYLLDIAVPNSHNITQTYNTKINKYSELSVAMRNLWCLEKISILPLVISATGIVPQSLFKNLKILNLDNTLVVEIQKGILLYSCHIVRKFLNIDTEHNTQQSQNAEARRRYLC
jgi:hypothetical protein